MRLRYVFPKVMVGRRPYGESYEYAEANSREEILGCLDHLFRWNLDFMQRYDLPPLYECGAYYAHEPFGKEDWLSAPIVIERKAADCEDLSCYRAAELVLSGEDRGARPEITVKNYPWGRLWHVQVKRTGGWIEDPSKKLGMGTNGL